MDVNLQPLKSGMDRLTINSVRGRETSCGSPPAYDELVVSAGAHTPENDPPLSGKFGA